MNELKVASYGGGVNSTAMLIECVKRGIKVDLIMFADTGGERPHTIAYVKMFSDWLVERGYPEITIVKKVDYKGDILTLEENCLAKRMLPSLAYGFKTCSQKFKIQPQDKYMNNWPSAKKEWKEGRKIIKIVGFDADESHRTGSNYEDKKYKLEYPLVDWDMGRDDCFETIENSALCQPGKSACFFCPASKLTEIRQLAATYPNLADRALAMERNADLTSVKGLGRRFSWADTLDNREMFEDEYLHMPEMLCGCYDGG